MLLDFRITWHTAPSDILYIRVLHLVSTVAPSVSLRDLETGPAHRIPANHTQAIRQKQAITQVTPIFLHTHVPASSLNKRGCSQKKVDLRSCQQDEGETNCSLISSPRKTSPRPNIPLPQLQCSTHIRLFSNESLIISPSWAQIHLHWQYRTSM